MNFKRVLVLSFVLSSISLNAQKEVKSDTITDLYTLVNTMVLPRFKSTECEEYTQVGKEEELKKCSQQAMWKFIYSNLRYPHNACIEGTVVIRFLVAIDGSIQEPEIMRDIGGGTGEEALRVVKLMPKWEPGKEFGRITPLYFNLPIRFRIDY